jgi:hypothetical protein
MGSSRSKTILLSAAAQRVADHVVDLLFAAGAHAAVALDAGVQVHGHGGVAQVGRGLLAAQGFSAGRTVTPRRSAHWLSSPCWPTASDFLSQIGL